MTSATWIPVGSAGDVPLLEGRSVLCGPMRVAIFRLPDGWQAVQHACPHTGGPLSDGIVADSCVTCPLHGRRFDLRTGAQQGGGTPLRTFEVRERDGRLELRVPGAVASRSAA